MPADRVLLFGEHLTLVRPRATSPARQAVDLSVARSIDKLPRLAQINPEAALLIERNIDDWMVPSSVPDDADLPPTHRRGLFQRAIAGRRQARAQLPIADVRAVTRLVDAVSACWRATRRSVK
jgi:hypothetical protein